MIPPILPPTFLDNPNPHQAKTQNLPTQNSLGNTIPSQNPRPTKKRREPNSTSNNWKLSPHWNPSTTMSDVTNRNSAPAPLPCRSQPYARPNAPSLHNPRASHLEMHHRAKLLPRFINPKGNSHSNPTLPLHPLVFIPMINFSLFPWQKCSTIIGSEREPPHKRSFSAVSWI
jgi:hypothetical protein